MEEQCPWQKQQALTSRGNSPASQNAPPCCAMGQAPPQAPVCMEPSKAQPRGCSTRCPNCHWGNPRAEQWDSTGAQSTAAQGSGPRQHRGGTSFSRGALRSVALAAHKLRRQHLGQGSHLNNAFLLLKIPILLKKGCGTLDQPCDVQVEATYQKRQ